MRWNQLEKQVRDGKVDPLIAQAQIMQIHQGLMGYCTNHYFFRNDQKKGEFIFPVKNHTHEDIGGLNGNGYFGAKYFDFYDNKKRFSHTAHDIFVYDNNFDGKCDFVGDYVDVLSATSGIVVSINVGWTPAQTNLRGGNYVWVFDPAKQEYLYYAHLQDVKVCVGQLVTAGQVLGNIGRTGLNAYKRRSITHLHFSVVQYAEARMRPRNPFEQLNATGRENARRKDVMNAKLSKRSGIAQR